MSSKLLVAGVVAAITFLAGCSPQIRPDRNYGVQREAVAGANQPVPPPLDVASGAANQPLAQAAAAANQIGTGVFIDAAPARARGVSTHAGAGTLTFNFENQPVQATVKAILGDVLHANYAISPTVKGSVTFATAQPVAQAEALPILQMLLSWTGNALVQQQHGNYLVVPVAEAAPGNLVPGLGAAPPSAGYAARLYPLHFVSAAAMQKLLKPFADDKAFLLTDPLRNLLVLGGTPDELSNYQRIIQTFDVDWLRGMSVTVIPLQHVQADSLVKQLDSVFNEQTGEKGQAMSSLVRLIPLQHSNSLVVITAQPAYIESVRKLVTTIDNGAGNSSGLYVYNVINVKASDLARHLNELFGNSGSGQAGASGAVAPGFSPLEQTAAGGLGAQGSFGGLGSGGGMSGGGGSESGGGGEAGGGGFNTGIAGGLSQNRRQQQGQGSVAFTTSEGVRIAAVNENNQLLVRATPGQWEKLLPVVERLDEKPLQVQIETRVMEVTLTGALQFGVQYYLGGLIGSQPGSPPNTDQFDDRHQGAGGLGGVEYHPGSDALFYSFAGKSLQFALRAMESTGNVKILSAPSAVVLNNQQTTFKVGEKIPVVQTYYTPGTGGSNTSNYNVGQVQYIDTGVLLDVIPRVSPGGLVYMDVQQVVSKPTTKDQYGNYTIANRALSTEVAVQSGQTVLLGGLIQQTETTNDSGVPWLSRIPFLGRLFGTTDRGRARTELILLITPRVIRNSEEARRLTDDYQLRFQSLQPILPKGEAKPASAPEAGAAPAQPPAAPANTPNPSIPAAAGSVGAQGDASTSGDWTVHVAAFDDDVVAQRFSARLRWLGYASYVEGTLSNHGTFWQVCVGPAVDQNEAERLRLAVADRLHIGKMQVVRWRPDGANLFALRGG